MAHALLSRRAVLGHGMAAAVLTDARCAWAAGPPDDPLLAALTMYRTNLRAYDGTRGLNDEESDTLINETWGPFWNGIMDGKIQMPPAASTAGAIMALQCAIDEDNLNPFDRGLIVAALNFLDGKAS